MIGVSGIKSLLLIALMITPFMLIPVQSTGQGQNYWTVDNGFIKLEFDLDHGGLLANVIAACNSFANTPVGTDGVGGIRGGGLSPAPLSVLWDLISDGNPWYGKAITTPANAEIVEDTDNYTIFKITYTITEDPFSGLQVVKTFKLYKKTFWMDFNMTLINTGSKEIKIDLSQAWGRPIGPGIEMVGMLGKDNGNDGQFIIHKDGTFEHYIQGSSWSGAIPGGPVKVEGDAVAIGLIDNSTDPSPWGWVEILEMADEETIAKTSYVWFETAPGGTTSTLVRIEFQPVDLQPNQKEEYHMKFYSGPISEYFLTKFKISKDIINQMLSDQLSLSIPCVKVTYKLRYPINVQINTVGGKGIPDNAIYLYDADTKAYLGEVSFANYSSTQFQIKLPFKEPHRYILKLAKVEGLTLDGYGRFTFENWILPNGSKPTDIQIVAILKEGDTLGLNFTVKLVSKLTLVFVGSDQVSELDALAGNITFKIVNDIGVQQYKATSIGIIVGSSQQTTRRFKDITLVVPGKYRIILPKQSTGGFVFQKALLNGTELPATVQGDTVKVDMDLQKPGYYELKIIYGAGGVSGGPSGFGTLVWIGVIVALIIIVAAIAIMRRKK